jgi:spermidine synthase
LCFVRDNGDEVVESSIDLIHPEYLQLKYTQAMFAGLLLNKKLPLKTLLVGLGGAGMPHFSSHYFPEIEMKIVEIDPEIIKIAKNHFMITEKISKNIYNYK